MLQEKNDSDLAVLRTSDDQPDGQWQIAEDHYYKVTVNLLTGEVTFTQEEGNTPVYDQLYFVGDMTDWGFVEMTQDPLDHFSFSVMGNILIKAVILSSVPLMAVGKTCIRLLSQMLPIQTLLCSW